MKENVVIKKIKDELESRGVTVFKYHGTQYGVRGHSDLYGHFRIKGTKSFMPFYLEVKVPGKEPSKHQYAFLERIKESGAIAIWADSVEMMLRIIGHHLPEKLST